jgi:predicted secreted protein
MANELDGRGIYLIIDDSIFANEQGVTNSETKDSLETTNKHTPNKRKTFITGEGTGTITANGLYAITDETGYDGYHALKTKMKAGAAVTYELGYMQSGGLVETGSAIITSLNMTANRNEPATYDITLQKTGDYTETSYSS